MSRSSMYGGQINDCVVLAWRNVDREGNSFANIRFDVYGLASVSLLNQVEVEYYGRRGGLFNEPRQV